MCVFVHSCVGPCVFVYVCVHVSVREHPLAPSLSLFLADTHSLTVIPHLPTHRRRRPQLAVLDCRDWQEMEMSELAFFQG
jgi:hypothetical protein